MCIQNTVRFVTCSCLICISISMVSRFSASTDGRICIEAFRSMISSFLSGIGDWSCCCGEIMQIIFTCDMDVVHPVPCCVLSPRTASDRRRRRRRPLAVAGRTLCAELSAAIPVVWRAGNWTDRAARTRCDTAATGRRSAWTARWPANDTKICVKLLCLPVVVQPHPVSGFRQIGRKLAQFGAQTLANRIRMFFEENFANLRRNFWGAKHIRTRITYPNPFAFWPIELCQRLCIQNASDQHT